MIYDWRTGQDSIGVFPYVARQPPGSNLGTWTFYDDFWIGQARQSVVVSGTKGKWLLFSDWAESAGYNVAGVEVETAKSGSRWYVTIMRYGRR
jgi:hypothetical protein